MAMISQDGAPSLKVSFQITHIPPDETSAEIDGDNQSKTCRFQRSSQVEEGTKIGDFRYFR